MTNLLQLAETMEEMAAEFRAAAKKVEQLEHDLEGMTEVATMWWQRANDYKLQLCKAKEQIGTQSAQDGWIEWRGGECPVEGNTRLQFRFRDGDTQYGIARSKEWEALGTHDDIIAYRVVQADTTNKLTTENAELKSQLANLNGLLLSRGREIEKLRTDAAEMRGALASALQTKESAIAGIEYRDRENEKLRAEIDGLRNSLNTWDTDYKAKLEEMAQQLLTVAESAAHWRNEYYDCFGRHSHNHSQS